jgi:hypothetical protein
MFDVVRTSEEMEAELDLVRDELAERQSKPIRLGTTDRSLIAYSEGSAATLAWLLCHERLSPVRQVATGIPSQDAISAEYAAAAPFDQRQQRPPDGKEFSYFTAVVACLDWVLGRTELTPL